jgi:hypothetical protein
MIGCLKNIFFYCTAILVVSCCDFSRSKSHNYIMKKFTSKNYNIEVHFRRINNCSTFKLENYIIFKRNTIITLQYKAPIEYELLRKSVDSLQIDYYNYPIDSMVLDSVLLDFSKIKRHPSQNLW